MYRMLVFSLRAFDLTFHVVIRKMGGVISDRRGCVYLYVTIGTL